MSISHTDLSDLGDEDRALIAIATVRLIAPCVLELNNDDPLKAEALAVIRAAVREMPDAGYARARSLSRNGTAITMDAADELFSPSHRALLRAMCGSVSPVSPPVGSFPLTVPSGGLWPEGSYS